MRRLLGLAAVALFLIFSTPAYAQSGRLIFADETGQLNRVQIQQAAQPLIDRGAEVAIYMADNGGADDFQQRMEADELASGQSLNANLIAIYVSLNPRYSELAGGDQWNAALIPNGNIETIRTTKLNPGLASGNYTTGFVDTLTAIDAAIANPPTVGGSTIFTVNFIPLVVGGFFLLVLVVGGGAFMRWRASARTLADARERYERAKRGAGTTIADMGLALDRAREKAQFDAISYTTADAQRIGAAQQGIETAFRGAQVRFDDIGEQFAQQRGLQVTDYTSTADTYNGIQQQVATFQEELAQIETQRKELDALAQQALQEIDRAKKV